jgi:predicted dehydrogenase
MLNAAIIGLGWWGKVLVRSVQGKSDAIRYVAGTARTPEKYAGFAAEHGFDLLPSYEAVLADPRVDAVVLATPHKDHEAQIVAAAKAGKHVFAEKPLAMTVAGAETVVAAMKAAGLTLGLGHNRRFHPNMGRLRTLVRSGGLGTILHVEATMTGPNGLFLPKESWRVDPEQSPAGGMAGLGIHLVDSMINLFGPITAAATQSVNRAAPTGAQDTTSVLLRFASGQTGMITAINVTASAFRFAVYGSKGIAEIRGNGLDELIVTSAPHAPVAGSHGVPKTPEVFREGPVDTVLLELEAFARAAAGGEPYPITAEEMIHGIAVFETIARGVGADRFLPVPPTALAG